MNGSTGVISGTPTADGTFNFTVKATNGGGSDSETFSLTVNRTTGQSTGSSGSSGGSGSSYQEREYAFWQDVQGKLEDAGSGDTVKANAGSYDRMPWTMMEALRNAGGVTLHITWDGGEDIIIPPEAALTEQSRVYYPLSYLEDMTFEVESEAPAADLDKVNPETDGILEVTAPAAADTITIPAGEPEVTDLQRGLTAAPELAEAASSSPSPASAGRKRP